MKKKQAAAAVLFIIVGVIVGLGISSSFDFFSTSTGFSGTTISGDAMDLLSKIDKATSEVAAAVKPSVVNISSTTTVRMRETASPFFNDPFFREFFGDRFRMPDRQRQYKQSGSGSGVIVDKDGLILTNYHVIKEADEIKVTLSTKKAYKGKVVGKDPKTDLAVVKIDAKDLPAIRFGNSDDLKVGVRVIAIGNPFGLTQTVTTGIISAVGRADVGIADYEDFIQTDAPINPGNSGGALVNIRGELIGINTAIISMSGGYQGIGFAIPSNMAKTVMDNLIKKGKIVRGWFGVNIQALTPELAKEFKVKDEKGVLIADVVSGGPAEEAGIQRGDVIIEFDGKEVRDTSHLKNMVANTSPGKTVAVKLSRNGEIKTVRATMKELPDKLQAAKMENQLRGVTVQNLTPEIRGQLNLPNRVTGVVVSNVDADSPASEVLAAGDVILEINKKKIADIKDFEKIVSKIKSDQKMLLLIVRNGMTAYVTL
jgi:serine protease Do